MISTYIVTESCDFAMTAGKQHETDRSTAVSHKFSMSETSKQLITFLRSFMLSRTPGWLIVNLMFVSHALLSLVASVYMATPLHFESSSLTHATVAYLSIAL